VEQSGQYFFDFLVHHRNPCPEGKVRVHWVCLLNDPLLHPDLICPNNIRKGVTNESFSKAITNHLALRVSYALGPKYRYRVIAGEIADQVNNCIRVFSEQLKCEIVELNVCIDHVHILVMVPPKESISDYVGTING